MDNKVKTALEETETMDGLIIEGNNSKVVQFLSLREHLMDSINRCEELEKQLLEYQELGAAQAKKSVTVKTFGNYWQCPVCTQWCWSTIHMCTG